MTKPHDAGIAPQMVWYFRVVSLVAGFIALVLYLNGTADNRVVQSHLSEVRAARMRGERPFGIILVGICDGVSGLLGMVIGVGALFGSQILDQFPMSLMPFDDQLAFMAVSLILSVFGAMTLAAAYGIWTLQVWALPLQVGICLGEMACDAISFFYAPPTAGSLYAVAGLISASVILVYVSRPAVQAFYGRIPDYSATAPEPASGPHAL